MTKLSHDSPLSLIQIHAETLFVHDGNGRLRTVNEPWSPESTPASLVYIGRTREGVICRCRHDVADELCAESAEIAGRFERNLRPGDPAVIEQLQQRLEQAGWTIGNVAEGPAYVFDTVPPPDAECVVVGSGDASLLHAHFADCIPELGFVNPCVAAVVDGDAVSLCRTVRRSARGVEAGVETAVAYRRQGLAAGVVTTWAALVHNALGVLPMYSTSWENVASQGLATKLGLVHYGTDLYFTSAKSQG